MTAISLQPLSLDSLYILGAVNHPAVSGSAPETVFGPLQIAQLVFVAAEPQAALDALQAGPKTLNDAAFAFCRQIPLAEIKSTVAQIVRELTEAFPQPAAGVPLHSQPDQSTK